MGSSHHISYRPEIDGLRAVAVVPVLVFHAGLGMPGGFVGVDVFFVISGYLITSLIVKDIESGRFTLADFWERRVRRILPAALAVVLATLAAGWFLLLPSDYSRLARASLTQAVFGANVFYWRSTHYFAGTSARAPLLHTWSLAVEEQFYVLFPIVLNAPVFRKVLGQRRVMLLLLGVPLLVSFAVCVAATPRFPGASFYLLPTRAWELLCGSVLAVVTPWGGVRPLAAAGLGWSGLMLIAYAYWAFSESTPFPGMAAMLPCLGTMLVIYGTAHEPIVDGSTLSRAFVASPRRILSARLLVGIGLVSYSLYLWHWPPLAFAHCWALEPVPLVWRVALLAGSVVAAVLSWRFIETPFRTKRLGASRRGLFALAGAGLSAMVVVAGAIVGYHGVPARFSREINACDSVRTEPVIPHKTPVAALEAGDVPRLGRRAAEAAEVLVWGDSHARCFAPVIDQLATEAGVAAEMIWFFATPPVCGYEATGRYSLGRECPRWADLVIKRVEQGRIRDVILAARWADCLSSSPTPQDFPDALIATIRRLRDANCRVWVVCEVPNHRADVPSMMSSRLLFGTDVGRFKCSKESHAARNAQFEALVPRLEAAGATVVDPAPLLVDRDGSRYAIENGIAPLYSDTNHISVAGAMQIKECFRPCFAAIAAEITDGSAASR